MGLLTSGRPAPPTLPTERWLASGAQPLDDGVGNLEIGVDLLHVIVVLERVEHAQQLLSRAIVELDTVLRLPDDLRAARPQAEIHLSLRGLGRRYRIPVVIGRGGGTISVSGSVALQQTDLGITPFAALGGALSVRNRIDVDFRIIGRNGRPRLW